MTNWIFQDLSRRYQLTLSFRFISIEAGGYTSLADLLTLIPATMSAFSEAYSEVLKLLDQMKTANEVRPAIIDQFEYDMLLEYLSFRHMVRHTYPGTLSWDGFREIAENLSDSRRRIDECIRRFLGATFGRETDEVQAPE